MAQRALGRLEAEPGFGGCCCWEAGGVHSSAVQHSAVQCAGLEAAAYSHGASCTAAPAQHCLGAKATGPVPLHWPPPAEPSSVALLLLLGTPSRHFPPFTARLAAAAAAAMGEASNTSWVPTLAVAAGPGDLLVAELFSGVPTQGLQRPVPPGSWVQVAMQDVPGVWTGSNHKVGWAWRLRGGCGWGVEAAWRLRAPSSVVLWRAWPAAVEWRGAPF